MNKVYFFSSDDDFGGVYVAEENFKQAKAIAITHEIISDHCENPFVDARGHQCKTNGKQPILSMKKGILDIQEIINCGVAWWDCDECGSSHMTVLEGEEKYVCEDCAFEGEIPYVG
jgi:hypothetical protein